MTSWTVVARSGRDPLPAAAVDHVRKRPLARRHREHDRLDALQPALVDVGVGELAHPGHHLQDALERPHAAEHLLGLQEVVEGELPLAHPRLDARPVSSSEAACSARSISVRTSPMPRMREAIRSGWKTSSASSFSPVEANMIGRPVTVLTESAAPPRASPSSFVRMTPSNVDPLLERGRDRRRPAGRSSRRARAARSSGSVASRTRSSSSISSSSTWRRPAVSMITVSSPSAAGPLEPARAPPRRDRTCRCGRRGRRSARRAARAGRSRPDAARSAATSAGLAALLFSSRASLAAVVVLPEPWRPGEQDHRGAAELELGRVGAEQVGQLLVDDLHDLLARASGSSAPPRRAPARGRARRMRVTTLEVDVGLEQRAAGSRASPRDRLLVEPAPLAQVAEGAREASGTGCRT